LLSPFSLSAGVVDDAGAQRPPGLRMSSVVAVPSLSIPSSRVEVVVAGSNGVVPPNIAIQVTLRALKTKALICFYLLYQRHSLIV
jgi:hypothetical protein